MTAPLHPAATVVLVRDKPAGIETLLLRRSQAVKFGGGAWVFPGGKVERSEQAAMDELAAAKAAAVRECEEEASIQLATDDLLPFSHWTTPEGMSKRFATWFFISRVTDRLAVTVDGSEIDDYLWCLAATAVERHQRGELSMMPPTVVTLSELAAASDCDAIFRQYQARNVRPFIPRTTYVDDKVCMLYQGDAGYDSCNPRVAGPRNRLWLEDGNSRYENTID